MLAVYIVLMNVMTVDADCILHGMLVVTIMLFLWWLWWLWTLEWLSWPPRCWLNVYHVLLGLCGDVDLGMTTQMLSVYTVSFMPSQPCDDCYPWCDYSDHPDTWCIHCVLYALVMILDLGMIDWHWPPCHRHQMRYWSTHPYDELSSPRVNLRLKASSPTRMILLLGTSNFLIQFHRNNRP